MKDGLISKLISTKTGHRPTQYKKNDTLTVLYIDKNYQGINAVIWTTKDLIERDFMPPYLNAN